MQIGWLFSAEALEDQDEESNGLAVPEGTGLFSIPWRILSRFLDMTSKPYIACLLLLFPVFFKPQCNSDVLYFTTVSLNCQLLFFIHLSHHDVFLNVLKIRHF